MARLLRIRVLGIAFFLVVALFVWLCIAIYNKDFTSKVKVEMITDTVGNALPQQADVKVRGLTVGYVDSTSTHGQRVTSQLYLQPDAADKIPANVTARLLPKTLFGERYVELELPASPSDHPLSDGDVIYQDPKGNALELTQLFDTVLPVLQAIPPQRLAETLGSLAEALTGRGADLGVTVDRLQQIVGRLDDQMPDIQEDLRDFATFSHTYADALPDLVDALNDFRTTNATVIQRRHDVDQLVASLTPTAGRLTDFLDANHDNIIDVAADSRQTLNLLAEYSPTYPCVFRNFAIARPKIDAIMGQGTDEPGSRVSLKFVNPRGRYLPNQDEPRWFDTRGPQCEPVPPNGVNPGQYVGGSIDDGSYQPPSRFPGNQNVNLPEPNLAPYNPDTEVQEPGLDASPDASTPQTGHAAPAAFRTQPPTVAGSPIEQRQLAAIYSSASGVPAQQIPSWVTLIGAPAMRGSQVSVSSGEASGK
jgi:phospholipid/cholesterol/gamma-HCH transport system substrate-binding protein